MKTQKRQPNYGKLVKKKNKKTILQLLHYTCTFHLIINVGKTLILGMPRKQNGHPIGYIVLLTLISPLKCGVQRLRRLIYGQLLMAKLADH